MVVKTASSLLLEPAAPGWAARLVLRLQSYFVPVDPATPQTIWATTYAKLPAPAEWPGAIAWVTDKGKLCVSNGTAWVTTDGGAP